MVDSHQPQTLAATAAPRLLVSRPAGDPFSAALEKAGYTVVSTPFNHCCVAGDPHGPNISTVNVWEEPLRNGHVMWVVFASRRGVEVFNKLFPDTLAAAAKAGTHFAVIGPATGVALRHLGLEPDLTMPASAATGQQLGQALRERVDYPPQKPTKKKPPVPTVLCIGSALSRWDSAVSLHEAGWDVTYLPVYTMMPLTADELPAGTIADWQDGQFACAVVTAPSAARVLVTLCGKGNVVCIGDTTAATAKKVGLNISRVAKTADPAGVVEAVQLAFPLTESAELAAPSELTEPAAPSSQLQTPSTSQPRTSLIATSATADRSGEQAEAGA